MSRSSDFVHRSAPPVPGKSTVPGVRPPAGSASYLDTGAMSTRVDAGGAAPWGLIRRIRRPSPCSWRSRPAAGRRLGGRASGSGSRPRGHRGDFRHPRPRTDRRGVCGGGPMRPVREALTASSRPWANEREGFVAEAGYSATAVFPNADLKCSWERLGAGACQGGAPWIWSRRGFPRISLLELGGPDCRRRDRLEIPCSGEFAPLAQADDAIELIMRWLEIEAVTRPLVESVPRIL